MKKLSCLLFILVLFHSHAQTPITSIPFELYGDHIFMKVSIDNSRPLNFIFDTGSGYTVLDEDIVKELDLPINKEIELNATSSKWSIIKHNTIEIDGFLMEKNIKVYSTDLDHLEISLGRDIDGIVGYDLLKHHSIYVNFDLKAVNIYELGEGPKKGDAIPFELELSIPVIKGNVVLNNNESLDGTFFVITGAGTTLDFNTPFAQEYDIINKTGKHYAYYTKSISQKEYLHYEGHVLSLKIGEQLIEDLPIGISTSTDGSIQGNKKVAGVIGNEILRLYNFSLDYLNNTLYLQKDEAFEPKFSANCSGIDLQLSPDKERMLIHAIIENSPASEAGIQKNAELISINDMSVEDLDMPDIAKILKKSGETVKLVINQDGSNETFSLKLRSLIE